MPRTHANIPCGPSFVNKFVTFSSVTVLLLPIYLSELPISLSPNVGPRGAGTPYTGQSCACYHRYVFAYWFFMNVLPVTDFQTWSRSSEEAGMRGTSRGRWDCCNRPLDWARTRANTNESRDPTLHGVSISCSRCQRFTTLDLGIF